MKFTSYPDFLGDKETYSTPPNRKKRIINPTFSYYRRYLNIVLKSNYKTKIKIYDRYNWMASSLDVVQALEDVGVRFEIKGLTNITKPKSPVVFISNHMSTLETMALPSIIEPKIQVVYIIKEELTRYPLFGPIAAARHPICVGRANPREDMKIVMEEGEARIKDGRSIIIFPQKTRSTYLEKKSFNSLGIKLAKKCGVPVIPLALATDAWGNGAIIKDFGKIDPNKIVRIEFGEPMEITGNGSEQHEAVVSFIESKFVEWGRDQFIK